MDQNIEELFSRALGIEAPWKIRGITFNSEKKRLEIQVDFERGAVFEWTDPESGEIKEYKAYDTVEKTWRHLNFFEHECYLVVRTPRIQPESGGTKLVSPPWSGVVSGFTLLFEAYFTDGNAYAGTSSRADIKDLRSEAMACFGLLRVQGPTSRRYGRSERGWNRRNLSEERP